MLVSKVIAYLSEDFSEVPGLTHKPNRPEPMLVVHLSGIPLYSSLLVLPTNIRLGWKGLRGTSTLAYWAHS